jgi:TolB-like protein
VDIEERFRRERQFLASLDHPKIARLIDGGVTGSGLPYLVMEFVDGLTIDRYCEVHRLNPRARIAMMRQVLEALIYVHGQQVMHRDLKPSNILVDAAGNAKLLDFGTARLMDASGDTAITKTGVFAFTPDCASPEQVQGKPLTFASDVYSSGVLLYRLLTGRPPYRFTDYFPAAIAAKISHTEPEPSGLDRPLDAILSSTLHKDPESRYASAAEMDADLARYLAGEPVRARRQGKAGRSGKPWAIAAAVAFCALTAWAWIHRAAVTSDASIAVLPFSSVDPANRYLSSGFTDEITDALSRLRPLRVIAPASVAQFKGKQVDFREVGRTLQVTNVLEGSVDRSGDRVRIVAKLERVADGALVWSSTYERQESDLLAVQSALSAEIARSLNVAAPSKVEHAPTAEAHEYAMKARFEAQQVTSESMAQAEADFQRAIDLDPQYAPAYLDLGLAKYDQYVARGSAYQTDEERKSAEQLIHKALDLNPDLPAAHAALGLWAMQYDWDWNRAERELHLAIAGAPNSQAEQYYAFFLIFRGHFAEADQHIRRMQDLNPFSASSRMNVALARNLEGRFAQAREIAQQVAAESPRMLAPQQLIGGTYTQEGHPELALPIFRQLEQRFPEARIFEAMALAKSGQRDEALRLIRPYEEKYPNPGVAMQWFALVYAAMGDGPDTVKWLGRSADRREFQALNLAVNPVFAPMRNSPGFVALKKRMGLVQ